MKLSDLLQNPLNRKIDRAKVAKIKQAIKTSGVIKPLVYTEIMTDKGQENMLTDGHHRYVALKEMGYKDAPAVMSDERGIKTAQFQDMKPIHKGRKPCPEGYYRDKDGKCRRRANYGLIYSPHRRHKKPENGNGETPPSNGEMAPAETAKAAIETLRNIAKLINKQHPARRVVGNPVSHGRLLRTKKHGSHDQSDHAPGSSKKPSQTFGRISSKQVDFIERQVPGVKAYYNNLPANKRPKTATDLITQFEGLQRRPKRKVLKSVDVLRELVAKLNRLTKEGVSATDVAGLELTREDLQDEIAHAHPGRRKKGWTTPGSTGELTLSEKMDMDEGVDTKHPYKNPEGANVEGGRASF